jgi:hypothetical protein
MSDPQKAKLKFLHPNSSLSPVKLKALRELSSEKLKAFLKLGQTHSLKARPDGTVLDGHHRLAVLLERGVDINALPREIIEKKL